MVLGIIPAKGTSEGVSEKNIKELGDTPLIEWTLDAAKYSNAIDELVVITESEVIGKIARFRGVTVLEEPRFLARPDVQVDTVAYFALLQAIHELDIRPDTVVVLQPTSPFRNAGQISEAIDMYKIDRRGSVMGMSSSRKFPYLPKGRTVFPIHHDPANRRGRDDYDTDDMLLFENGSIYVVGADDLILNRTFRVEPIAPYTMSDLTSLEIDTRLDWTTAESVVAQWEKDGNSS